MKVEVIAEARQARVLRGQLLRSRATASGRHRRKVTNSFTVGRPVAAGGPARSAGFASPGADLDDVPSSGRGHGGRG